MRYSQIKLHGADVRLAHFDINRNEVHAMITCQAGHDARQQIGDMILAEKELSQRLGMNAVFKRYLLSDATNQSGLLPEHDHCAVSVIQQAPLNGSKAACLVIYQQNASFVSIGNGAWRDNSGRIWMGDNGSVPAADSKTMTEGYLEQLGDILSASGGSLKDHCVRTWFYVRDVDNNYAGVVSGRNEVFARHGLTADTHFIASTGIAGQCADPTRLVAFNAFADTALKESQVRFLYGNTHLNPTSEYGVAFERGTAVDYGDRRHVYISGTASIDNKGNIVAPGDIVAQTDRMFENIAVLLKEGGCSWNDVAHMIVYLRDTADHGIVSRILGERFPDIPQTVVLAPVCRPGWLIETECFAIRHIDNNEYAPF
ncbi:MAG: hypothetical protein K2G24_01250 [Muribaculaceae bacterium]|nr:hypothetical protein [Muribaculaceae bacterium]